VPVGDALVKCHGVANPELIATVVAELKLGQQKVVELALARKAAVREDGIMSQLRKVVSRDDRFKELGDGFIPQSTAGLVR
jgi:hypothetical protein